MIKEKEKISKSKYEDSFLFRLQKSLQKENWVKSRNLFVNLENQITNYVKRQKDYDEFREFTFDLGVLIFIRNLMSLAQI